MKKHLLLFAGVCFAMSMMAESVNINSSFSGFTKEDGNKFIGTNAGAMLKRQDMGTPNTRDLVLDFELKGSNLNFVPDTVTLNIFVSNVDQPDSVMIYAYAMNHYTCTGYAVATDPKFTEARAMGGLLCDSIGTCKTACMGKFLSFNVKGIMDSLTTDSILGFRVEVVRNMGKNEPLLTCQTYKGATGQRPFLHFAKASAPSAIQNVAAKQQIVNAQYGTINLNNVAEGQVVTVYNMQGQLVTKEVVTGGSFNAQVPANYYIINVK